MVQSGGEERSESRVGAQDRVRERERDSASQGTSTEIL